jgi:hypothetical protein
MAEPLKDECTICTWVLVAAGIAVAGVIAYMAVDLATDGKLSAMIGKVPGLATVTELHPAGEAPGDSDAG